MPIVRAYHGTRTVREMEINPDPTCRPKLLRTIEHSYRRAPHFGEVYPWLEPLVLNGTSELAEYNLHAIRATCTALNLTTPIVVGTSLGVDGRATELLIRMVKAVAGTAYLAGGGTAGYQEDAKFQEAGITLIYQKFQHPTYPQFNTSAFQPGLSIVDALMSCGFAGTSELLKGAQ
jgi:WbqC-like protein